MMLKYMCSLMCRTPNLKRLVFPVSGDISKNGIETAMRSWRGLESITITSVVHHINFFDAVRKYCMDIISLKITCRFEQYEARALVNYTPNLKVLSIRNMTVNMGGLCHVLNNLEHLEVVNLSHSLIVDKLDDELQQYSVDDVQSRVNNSCKLITCQIRTCLWCKTPFARNPRRMPHGTLEDIWRDDEIRSLSH
ncbi:putative leucine-rich repeat domain, L domain-containing protein [Medicago truncatula]|uniref:Putative leucine-rich repeat domain, L domain-containing protein n=1 Tax=Medicago truncatula TaxID=3880 RepID=A0A396H4U2_MEDTR|nr:putative leucine-rich repeat domain, L domain-containing protein [Medicago truncatula]